MPRSAAVLAIEPTDDHDPLAAAILDVKSLLRAELEHLERRLTGQIRTAERKAARANEAARHAKDMLSGDLMDRARKDASDIHACYRLVVLKLTVATEVVFLARVKAEDPIAARNLAVAVVRAFDLPDAWWQEREDHNLATWTRTLSDIAKHGLPHIPAAGDTTDDGDDTDDETEE